MCYVADVGGMLSLGVLSFVVISGLLLPSFLRLFQCKYPCIPIGLLLVYRYAVFLNCRLLFCTKRCVVRGNRL